MTFDELFAAAPAGDGRVTLPAAPRTDEQRPFGGQLLGQAVAAASLGMERPCHALHALFIGAGWMEEPTEALVDSTRDGRSFSTRRIELRQRERLLLAAFASHHDGDDGPAHQAAMPDVPPPETLEDRRVVLARRAEGDGRRAPHYLSQALCDIRVVEPSPERGEGRRATWFRPRVAITGGAAIHRAAIAFASDIGLVSAGLQVHRAAGGPIQVTSLDHAIWFHREPAVDDWMVQIQHGPTVAHGRGFARSTIFTRGGVLVASAAQEFLARTDTGPRLARRGE